MGKRSAHTRNRNPTENSNGDEKKITKTVGAAHYQNANVASSGDLKSGEFRFARKQTITIHLPMEALHKVPASNDASYPAVVPIVEPVPPPTRNSSLPQGRVLAASAGELSNGEHKSDKMLLAPSAPDVQSGSSQIQSIPGNIDECYPHLAAQPVLNSPPPASSLGSSPISLRGPPRYPPPPRPSDVSSQSPERAVPISPRALLSVPVPPQPVAGNHSGSGRNA